jgi:hypothetical protein
MPHPRTAQDMARQISNDIEDTHRQRGHDVTDVDWSVVEQHALDVITGAVAVRVDRDRIRAAISTAYYDTRNTGGTMETAADAAADAVLAIITTDSPDQLGAAS